MAEMTVPADLYARLKARDQTEWAHAGAPLTDDEREMLALQLEWLAAEVREKPVHEVTWSKDRHVDDTRIPGYREDRAVGPWKHTVEVEFK